MAGKWYTVKREGQGMAGAYVVVDERNYSDVAGSFPVSADATDEDDEAAYEQADTLKKSLNQRQG
jgi:hypothetical protein